MVDLDNSDEIKRLDPKQVLASTGMLADQCQQIWQDSRKLEVPENYQNCQNIVVCGMGGSAYGGYVAASLFKDQLKVPVFSNNDYYLPGFVDSNSLIVLSSYSGTTEEVLYSWEEAKEKNLKISGITGGGKLGELFRADHIPSIIFDSKFNPSGQPRLGMGYMVLGLIAILNKLRVINVSDQEIEVATSELRRDQDDIKKAAKELAKKIYGFIPVIFAGGFLSGNAHILRNQFNETAKSFSTFSELPELNHHLMEGLKNPSDKKLFVLFISSDLYFDKLKKRLELTEDVVGKNNVVFSEYQPSGSSELSQVLNVLSFGGYVTLYLAFLYGQDPSVIPWVDYFKEQLGK